MLTDGVSKYGLGFDALVLALVFAVLVALAARMYPRLTC